MTYRLKLLGRKVIRRLFLRRSETALPVPDATTLRAAQSLRSISTPDASVVPVITVAPFHNSIGDVATAITTQQYLSLRGIPSISTSFWDTRFHCAVIGGGDILGGLQANAWQSIKSMFLPEGEHVLNAVGVDPAGLPPHLLSHIRYYRYVSARDSLSADILASSGAEVHLAPCPATLQNGIPLPLLRVLPRFQFLESLIPGTYAVIHRHPSLVGAARRLRARGVPIIAVDMQQHAQHPWGLRGTALPSTHSPEVIMGLVQSARFILTSSLHLAIFAMGSSVPFAVVDTGDYQSAKVRRYLARAGIEEAMAQPAALHEAVIDVSRRIHAVSDSEREGAVRHLEKIASVVSH